MTKKAEAEAAIRELATRWARETNYVRRSGWYPSFFDFKEWMSREGYSQYLEFRPRETAEYTAEKWLEDELKRWPICDDADA